jgi:pullulanase
MSTRSPLDPVLRLLLALALLAPLFPALPAFAQATPPPETVTIPGTIQSKLGCPGDWQPDCAKTFLVYDAEDDVWQGAYDLPAGYYEYKVAINQSWSENYGLNASPSGPNIPLDLPAAETVKFYYDVKTHWVTDNHNKLIVTVTGDFQTQLGCQQNDDPGCLRAWLEDPDGDGAYGLLTTALQPGTYHAQLAFNEGANPSDIAPSTFIVSAAGAEVYFGYNPATREFLVSTEGAPRGNLAKARAHWVTRDTIVWNVPGLASYTYHLVYAPDGGLQIRPKGIDGGSVINLRFEQGGPGDEVFKKFPHLAGYSTFKLAPEDLPKVPDILRGQMAVEAFDKNGKLLDATSLQIPGVLDDLYPYDGPLGLTFEGGVPTLRVWAPTARAVSLLIFPNSAMPVPQEISITSMTFDAATGVWSVVGDSGWKGRWYRYGVQVYVPSTGKVESNTVTDPYSLSLSTDSEYSQIVDLGDPALKPAGWDTLAKPPLAAPEDAVIYELHVRDFSAYDETVPPEHRGKYLAFTDVNSNGMLHLKALAAAGLTHVHLLPVFDIASVEEDPAKRQEPDVSQLKSFPGDSDQQAALIAPLKDKDAFNWGYDPYHYTVPEGSYASDPNGTQRIFEFRQMVMALNQAGLRVVLDVVYNHTSASGQDPKSVLDKLVPGYYYRLDADGAIETSTCCQNTATEHAMMRKLMVDSLRTWAVDYKVDGFRFDLMGHHMVADIQAARDALHALTPARDGVDGTQILLYGEGWDFGEVANNARGKNATQLNVGGLGVGTFNDRLRDAVRGGNPFGDPREQGFSTGLLVAPNAFDQGAPDALRAKALQYADWIRLGLAGNLFDYVLVSAKGEPTTGDKIYYGDKPAAYTVDPQEDIVYAAAHDNETLWDAIQLKAPAGATLADRVRMNNLAVSVVALSQGIPFFHAGDELLRSKSLDRNSYNSGDWFNRLDFTYNSNNWAVGLPDTAHENWPIYQPLLADPNLAAHRDDILSALANFEEMLQIRKSSPLFRLRTADEIKQRVTFYNTGSAQIPGLIVMRIADHPGPDLDPAYDDIVVVFNATPDRVQYPVADLRGGTFALHDVQANSHDALVRESSYDAATGTFSVPARTTAVFVQRTTPLPDWAPLAVVALIAGGAALGLWIVRRRGG